MSTATAVVARDNSFLWRRLHSLSGVFPIGVFLAEHLFSNSFALRGPEAFGKYVAFLTGLPFLLAIETALIFVPILFHGFYGLYIWRRGEPNVMDYPYAGNWMYFLQRVTGIIAFVYIGYHVWEQRFAGIHLQAEPMRAYEKVAMSVANPLVAAFYTVGIIAACFHLAYGLWLFGCKWGITVGPKAQKASAFVCGVVGVSLCSMGLITLANYLMKPQG
jgi:succinate dehydrogenase / fumarate reductase cytochrome b subunit